jgi:flagellar biosynthetic protein FliR
MSIAFVTARVTACLMTAPGFSSPRVSGRARLFLALLLSLLVEPLARERLAEAAASPLAAQAMVLLRETLIGAALGMVARVYLLAFEMATSAASTFMGLTAAFSPAAGSDEQMPTLSAAMDLAALMLIFASGLDAAMIRALVGSYASFGAPEAANAAAWLRLFLDSLRDATLIGLQIAGPILILSALLNLGLGVVSRFMPQVPIYFVSAPAMIGLGLAALYMLEKPMFGLLIDALGRRISSL